MRDATLCQASPQEVLVLEALRKALCAANIEHDDWDFIAYKCLDNLKAQGLVPSRPDWEAIIRTVDPHARISAGYTVHTPCSFHDDCPRTRAQAEELAAEILSRIPGEIQVQPLKDAYAPALRIVADSPTGKDGLEFWIHYTPEASDHA